MAYGDDRRARNQIEYQGNLAQNNLNNLRTRTVDQQYPYMWGQYVDATNRQNQDYGSLMGGWKNMANTGGFTPQEMASMRSRAIAPTRAVYENAMRNISRNRTLQGGYSPGYQAAQSRLQRDTGQQISDAAVNTEAGLAELKQRGRITGLQGGSNLYGTRPGQVETYGGQLQRNVDQQVDIEGLQGRLADSIMRNQIEAGKLPGRMDYWMKYGKDILDMAGGGIDVWGKIPKNPAGSVYNDKGEFYP